MNNKIEELYTEIRNFGVQMSDGQQDYIKSVLRGAYMAGRIAGLEEALEIQNEK